MTFALELFVCAAIVVGAVFTLVGSYGLVKLDKPMSRLHAPTKAGTLGVGSLLLASILYSVVRGTLPYHDVLVMAFLFVTAPISAHFIAKVHIHRDAHAQDLPKPPGDRVWATKDAPPQPDSAA